MEEIAFKPIGLIRSPFYDVQGMPVQSVAALGVKGTVELDPELSPGLKDLEGFSHIILIYYFHLNKGYSLHVIPFLDPNLKGVFATRVPRRPNGIGLSVVRLTGIKGNTLEIEDVDILDQTPLLDIKPFVPKFDHRDVQSTGWFAEGAKKASEIRADRRFIDQTNGH
jgi:tRNA-Thr(GGU) m(6)t(6)A37 methyltransferase TsaA